MKKRAAVMLLSGLGVLSQANALTLTPVSLADDSSGMSINHKISKTSDKLSNTFLSNEAINFKVDITIGNNDVGKAGKLFLLAQVDADW